MTSVYVICIGGVMLTSETISRDWHFLTPSVTLGNTALLCLLTVTRHCDVCMLYKSLDVNLDITEW